MNSYPVRLQKFIGSGGHGPSARIEYLTALPFVPVPGISLGLYPHSEWQMDRDDVEAVLWLAASREFLVRLREQRYASGTLDIFRWYFANGWRLALEIACDSREEACEQLAEDSADDGWRIVGARGGWWQVWVSDVALLRLSGEAFELVEPPYTAGAT